MLMLKSWSDTTTPSMPAYRSSWVSVSVSTSPFMLTEYVPGSTDIEKWPPGDCSFREVSSL